MPFSWQTIRNTRFSSELGNGLLSLENRPLSSVCPVSSAKMFYSSKTSLMTLNVSRLVLSLRRSHTLLESSRIQCENSRASKVLSAIFSIITVPASSDGSGVSLAVQFWNSFRKILDMESCATSAILYFSISPHSISADARFQESIHALKERIVVSRSVAAIMRASSRDCRQACSTTPSALMASRQGL